MYKVRRCLISNLAPWMTAGSFFFPLRSLSPLDRYDIQITLCISPNTIPLCRPSVRIIVTSQRRLTIAAINNNLICYRLGSPFRHAPLDGRKHSAVSGVQNTRCEGFLARRKCNSSPLVSGITYCSYGSPPSTGRE
jgi:hypothetical protein